MPIISATDGVLAFEPADDRGGKAFYPTVRMTIDDKKIDVVFMGHFHYPHGMAVTKRVRNFIEYLAGCGDFDVKVLVLRQGRVRLGESELSGQYKGTEYVTIGSDIRGGLGVLIKGPKYYLDGMAYLKKNRNRKRKNVLYVFGYPSTDNVPMLIGAKLLGYKVVFDIVEDIAYMGSAPDFFARVKKLSAAFFFRTLWMFADATIVISNHLLDKTRRAAKGRFGVEICPISVDFANFGGAVRSMGDPVRIFYGGTFGEKDGVENLIAAFEEVEKKRPNVRLVLTGKGDKGRMEIILDMIARSPSREKIFYKGYLADEDFYRELNESDILCMTRTASAFANTGFPFKLGEYLATGRPVIASDVSDVSQYLRDRENAVLIKPDSSEAIAEAMEYLLADSNRAMRIGAAGREVAEKCFDVKVVGEKLRELLTDL